MTIRTTWKWIETVGLGTCACGGAFHLTDPVDLARIGAMDARELPAEMLRALGWDDSARQRQRSPGRHTKQKQCRHAGCSVFVGKIADYCAHGHPQFDTTPPLADGGGAMPF